MTSNTLIALPGDEALAESLAGGLHAKVTALEYRRFPDGESYLRIRDSLQDTTAILVARLDRPDPKIPALLFAADLARDLGAPAVGLAAPYLPYMRQDIRFQPGEALTSVSFARWVSRHFDWLVTVDPHLHRYAGLNEIYPVPALAVSAAPALAEWIFTNVDKPVIVGPDVESSQWVEAVAARHGLPWRVMHKQRFGDREVRIAVPDLSALEGHTPVLVDDIVSSGATLARAAEALGDAGMASPVCAVVHGLFSESCRETLKAGGVRRMVCTDSVRAPEAGIMLAPLLTPAIERMSGCVAGRR